MSYKNASEQSKVGDLSANATWWSRLHPGRGDHPKLSLSYIYSIYIYAYTKDLLSDNVCGTSHAYRSLCQNVMPLLHLW